MSISNFSRLSTSSKLLVILLFVSTATHFVWIGYPAEVIFDEVHFGKFVTAYCCTHQNFFDIHPPHAKLFIAGTAYLFGYRGDHTFEHIGQPYGEISPISLRFFPSLIGTFLPALVYLLLRKLKANEATAFFGGMLILLDNSITVQTRIIALDGLMLASILGALIIFLSAKDKIGTWSNRHKMEPHGLPPVVPAKAGHPTEAGWQNPAVAEDHTPLRSRARASRDYPIRLHPRATALGLRRSGINNSSSSAKDISTVWWLFLLSGGLAGLAVGTKFTGLVGLGLIIVLLFLWLFNLKSYKELTSWIFSAVLIFVGALFVYFAGWLIHFSVLQQPGSGDVWRDPEWKAPLALSFLRESMEIQKIMYRANSGLTATHHDASPWWSWPLVRTPVFYWQHNASDGNAKTGSIYYMANPFLWWGITVVFIFALIHYFTVIFMACRHLYQKSWHQFWLKLKHYFQKTTSTPYIKLNFLPIVGYFLAYIPLMRVSRALFLYHYLTPLFFSVIAGSLWLQYTEWIPDKPVREQPKRYFIVLALVAIGFIMFSPLTFGFLIPPEIHTKLFWFKTWR